MLSGLDRVQQLTAGTGFVNLDAGVIAPFNGQLDAFARGEVGFHPTDSTSIFGFAEATLKQVQAGIGARLTF